MCRDFYFIFQPEPVEKNDETCVASDGYIPLQHVFMLVRCDLLTLYGALLAGSGGLGPHGDVEKPVGVREVAVQLDDGYVRWNGDAVHHELELVRFCVGCAGREEVRQEVAQHFQQRLLAT